MLLWFSSFPDQGGCVQSSQHINKYFPIQCDFVTGDGLGRREIFVGKSLTSVMLHECCHDSLLICVFNCMCKYADTQTGCVCTLGRCWAYTYYIYKHTYIYVDIYTVTYTLTTGVRVRTWTMLSTHTHAHTHTHTHIHTHKHTHTHLRIQLHIWYHIHLTQMNRVHVRAWSMLSNRTRMEPHMEV
jgi:hypothetical protein